MVTENSWNYLINSLLDRILLHCVYKQKIQRLLNDQVKRSQHICCISSQDIFRSHFLFSFLVDDPVSSMVKGAVCPAVVIVTKPFSTVVSDKFALVFSPIELVFLSWKINHLIQVLIPNERTNLYIAANCKEKKN